MNYEIEFKALNNFASFLMLLANRVQDKTDLLIFLETGKDAQ